MFKQSSSRRKGGASGAGRLSAGGFSKNYWILAGFLAFVLLTGGGSRHDITSLVVLRPVAFLVAAATLWSLTTEQLRAVRIPLLLTASIAGLIAIQMIPLPPSIWSALPGRDLILENYAAANLDPPWLPLAMSPSRALNSLMSLSVPLAALLLFARIDTEERRRVIYLVVAAAALSAIVGILQMIGPSNGPLHFYRITNGDLPVGLFANRNHQGLMIVFGILGAAWIVAEHLGKRQSDLLLRTLAIGLLFILLPLLLVTGSRAALLLGVAALVPGAVIVYSGLATSRSRGGTPMPPTRQKLILGAGLAALAGIMSLAIMFSRSLAFDRLVDTAGGGELRGDVIPSILALVETFFPVGSGFGSFEYVFRAAEPFELLQPAYLNHAHNDWVQVLIEGGLLAGIILAGFVLWVVKVALAIGRRFIQPEGRTALVALTAIGAVGIASLVDYPLRVPTIMAIFVLWVAMLGQERRAL